MNSFFLQPESGAESGDADGLGADDSNAISAAEPVRVANVHYLNSAPYHLIKHDPRFTYLQATPAEVARMLLEDEADLSLIPVVEFFNHGATSVYEVLPFGICSEGAVETVCLFANQPLESLTQISLDTSSRTSVVLLRLCLEQKWPGILKRIQFVGCDPELAADAVSGQRGALLIGDIAHERRGEFGYCLDLGECWTEYTGLPFVFAVWAARKDRVTEADRGLLEAAFRKGVEQRVELADEWLLTHESSEAVSPTSISAEFAHHYVSEIIDFELTPRHWQALELFQIEASAMGLLPAAVSSPLRPIHNARSLDSILIDASEGVRISIADGMRLALEASLGDLGVASDIALKRVHPTPAVSYIVDRNINYTNVCNVFCSFCAFYRGPGKSGGYLLTKEAIGKKIQDMLEAGGIQILLQGGLNPDLGIEYYEDLFGWIKANYPINLHGLSADEVLHISKVSNLSIDTTIDRLIAAGLGSLPGGGAEILVDSVRRRIARLKSSTRDWLTVHRSAHRAGITSTCTMMFGVKESWLDRFSHFSKLRHLQDETGGFTAFIAWPFQDENTHVKRGDTSAPEYLRVQAVSRLFLDNIPNIQSSWVTQGPLIGQLALSFGANDFGSVMFEENVVSAAGTTYCIDEETIERYIRDAGSEPWRRDVHYQRVA